MTAAPRFTLALPPNRPGEEPATVKNEGVVVAIGANGSGKTRLGSWLELNSEHKGRAHRVSAQKSLTIPESVSPKSVSEAAAELIYGYAKAAGNVDYKQGHRWSNNPHTSLLNDYQRLLVYLFSEDYELSINYRQKASRSADRIEPPETKLDIIKRIWERTIPHRELIIGGTWIETKPLAAAATPYSAAQMSDGERVVFYLIGECLAAPADAVIIIDEPELHLHKSIQARLWNEIEAERNDCQFVYLTHDTEFAASRVGAPKIWLRSFDGTDWSWDLIPEAEAIPEELLLELIGSRKAILFVEGDRDSLDASVYTHVYSDFTVVPVGSATSVIHNTAAFDALRELHDLDCRGVIDRDQRTEDQIIYLSARNIHVLDMSELENALLTEPVLRGVAGALLIENVDVVVSSIRVSVLDALAKDRDLVASRIVTSRIDEAFKRFDGNARGEHAIQGSLTAALSAIDVQNLYSEANAVVEAILERGDYSGALSVYHNKGLLFNVSRQFGLEGRSFREFIQRLLKADNTVKMAMRSVLPTLQ